MVQSREREQKYDAKPFAGQEFGRNGNRHHHGNWTGERAGDDAQPAPQRPPTGDHEEPKQSEKSRTNVDNVPVGEKVIVRQTTGFTAKAVQVAVAIPRKYYRDVLVGRGADEADKAAFDAKIVQLKAETEKDVREKMARLIPFRPMEPPPTTSTSARSNRWKQSKPRSSCR